MFVNVLFFRERVSGGGEEEEEREDVTYPFGRFYKVLK